MARARLDVGLAIVRRLSVAIEMICRALNGGDGTLASHAVTARPTTRTARSAGLGHGEGRLATIVGTTIATTHAANIGSSMAKLPVISVISVMPVIGARTTAVKNAAMPTTANASTGIAIPGTK